jgi:L-alanine-DL-glutamate epimerase-like enolase superfamily enzyme
VVAAQAQGMDVGLVFHGRVHRPMAKQLAKALEPLGLLFIEEPLLSENPEGLREIAALVSTPIALGERLYTRWEFKAVFERGAVDIIQPDLSHAGGILEVRKIAAMAEAYDIAVATHCPLGPLALAACLQIAACTPNHAIQEISLGIHYNTGGHDLLNFCSDPGPLTPIALGERLFSRWDFKPFFESGAVDIIQPDLSHAGGILEVRKIAAMAEAYDVALAPHCPLGPLALAACQQIAACTPNHAIQEMSLGIHYNVGGHDLLNFCSNTEALTPIEGYLPVPEGPGLGVEIDEAAVRDADKDRHRWRNPIWRTRDGSFAEW